MKPNPPGFSLRLPRETLAGCVCNWTCSLTRESIRRLSLRCRFEAWIAQALGVWLAKVTQQQIPLLATLRAPGSAG